MANRDGGEGGLYTKVARAIAMIYENAYISLKGKKATGAPFIDTRIQLVWAK